MNQNFFSYNLPILDDKVLYITGSNLQEQTVTGIIETALWFISYFSVGVLATLLFGRNEFCDKPTRLNVRDTPLYKAQTLNRRLKLDDSE